MNKNPEITLIPGCAVWNRTPEATPMSVRSRGIENGIIDIRFGIFGTDNVAGIPMRSLPFTIEHAPEGTRTFALTLLDYDSVPVAGFCWIHWLAANFDRTEMPENASAEDSSDFVQGVNSWGAPLLGPNALHREAASAYGGMVPPNGPHRYQLTVYALSEKLPLKDGFLMNELLDAMSGRVLAAATLSGLYPAPEE